VTGIFYVNLILLEDARKIFGLFTVISFLLIFSIVNFNKFFMAVKNGYIPSPFEGKKILSGTPYLFLSIFYLFISMFGLFLATVFLDSLLNLGIYHFFD